MMEGWKTDKIENLFFLGRGRVINDEDIKEHPGVYPVYSSQTSNNGEFGKVDFYEFEGEYITWTTDGANAGKVFYRSGKFNCTNVCGTLKPKNPEKTDVKFFSYLIDRHAFRHVAVVGNNKLMNNVMGKIKITFPTNVHHQSAIAAILSKVDEAIASVQASISAAERLKKSLMQNLLTGRMKPDGTLRKEDEFYVDEKFGKVPVGWEVKRIDEIAERKTEVIDPTKTKEVYDYIGLEHIVPDEFVRCGKGLSNETIALKVKFEKGDLLYGKLRPYLNKVFISDISGVGSTEFIVLKQNEFTNWIYLNFQLKRFLDYTKSMTAGTQHPRASWKDIKHYLVGIPKDTQEREQITKKLLSLEQHKTTNNNKIAVLERLKKSLMQNLLTGRVRVKKEDNLIY